MLILAQQKVFAKCQTLGLFDMLPAIIMYLQHSSLQNPLQNDNLQYRLTEIYHTSRVGMSTIHFTSIEHTNYQGYYLDSCCRPS